MASVYNKLGTNIIVNAIVYAKDVNDVSDFIVRELQRRGLGVITGGSNNVPEKSALGSVRSVMFNNLRTAGYTGAAPSAQVPTAAEIKAYINYAKTLYSKILKP